MRYQIVRFGGQYIVRRESKKAANGWEIFGGYDFMGSVNWVEKIQAESIMDLEEAKMTAKTLRAAD